LAQGVLLAHLAPYEGYAVWHFRNPLHVLSAFDAPGKEAAFQRRVDHLRPML
jgi:hypothetical protein